MGSLKDNRTIRGSVRRRFQPSSEAQSGPDLVEAGKAQEHSGDGRERLGRLVALRRAELGLTQGNLAERMDVSPATVRRIEDGERQSSETLKRLATALPSEEGNEVLLRSIERELFGRGAKLHSAASGRRRVRGYLLAGLALAALIPVAVLLAGRSSDGGDPSPEPAAVAAAPPPAPAPVQPVKKKKKPDKAEKTNSAPAASSDESSSSSDSTSSDEGSSTTETTSEPVSEPVVTPAPAPTPSRPSRPPSLEHGINPGG